MTLRNLAPLFLAFGMSMSLVACGDKDDEDTGAAAAAACQLAEEISACPECADGDVTCTYGELSVTELSCGDCQARSQLYNDLCDGGVEDSEADILAGVECSDPVNAE